MYAQRLVCKGSPSFTLSKSSRGGREGGRRERSCVLSCSLVPSPGVVSPRGVCPRLLSAHAFHPSLLLPPGLVAFPSHLGVKCCAERIQEAGRAGRVMRRASCLTFLCSSPYEWMSSVPKAHLTWHQKESCPPSRAVAGQLGSRQDAQGQPTASLSSLGTAQAWFSSGQLPYPDIPLPERGPKTSQILPELRLNIPPDIRGTGGGVLPTLGGLQTDSYSGGQACFQTGKNNKIVMLLEPLARGTPEPPRGPS